MVDWVPLTTDQGNVLVVRVDAVEAVAQTNDHDSCEVYTTGGGVLLITMPRQVVLEALGVKLPEPPKEAAAAPAASDSPGDDKSDSPRSASAAAPAQSAQRSR